MRLVDREVLIKDAEREGKLRKDKWDTESVVNFIKGAVFYQYCFGKWINIEDRKPNFGEPVLIAVKNYDGHGNTVASGYMNKDGNSFMVLSDYCFSDMTKYINSRVVAWMPFPEFPYID